MRPNAGIEPDSPGNRTDITTGALAQQTVQYGQLLRPFPAWQNVGADGRAVGNSEYEALQVSFSKRFTGGLSLADQAAVAVDALEKGISRCVTVSSGATPVSLSAAAVRRKDWPMRFWTAPSWSSPAMMLRSRSEASSSGAWAT